MTDTLSHLDISTEARERAAERDEALPDGSYPIRNKGDLQRAIQSYGRASDQDKVKVKKWIIKRARELDAVDMLPESWNVEEISHSDELMHHGVKGMKWGVRKPVDRVTTSTNGSKTTKPVEKDSDSTESTKNGGGGGGGGGGASDDKDDDEKDDTQKDDGIPEGDTKKEFDERQKMIDEFLKSKGKGDGAKKAGGGKGVGGGKGKGKGGGGKKGAKKGGAKKSSGGSSGSSTSSSTSSSVTSTSSPKTSYPARQSIANALKNVSTGPKITTTPAVQAIIDKITASVEARRKTAVTTPEDTAQHADESTGKELTMTQEETVAIGADSLDGFIQEKSNELAHYGVLGMKWGVRNDDRGGGRPQGGASRKKAPLSSVKKMVSSKKTKTGTSKTETQETNKSSNARVSEAKVETQQESAQKSGRSMSDQELRDAINRMQMEKTYAQLLAERNPGPAKKADSAIKKILRDSTKQAAGQLLTNTFKIIGTYAVAAAISKQNPALANALMKGVGDNAKKATETKTDSPDAPDATVSTPKTPSQNKSNTPKSNLGIPEADAWVDKTATKITNDFMATMPKAKGSSSLLDLGPTPQVDVPEWSVRRAYQNASENYTPESILDELSAYRKR